MYLTPQERIKWLALIALDSKYENYEEIENEFGDIETLYEIVQEDNHDYLQDILSEIRFSGTETNIFPPDSRYYEAESVASKCPDGKWVGWTYWYGGGKHGCPEDIEWISDAYNLDCEEREVLQTVRTFTKIIKES